MSGGQLYYRVTNEICSADLEFGIWRISVSLIRGEHRLEIKARVPENKWSSELMGMFRVMRDIE